MVQHPPTESRQMQDQTHEEIEDEQPDQMTCPHCGSTNVRRAKSEGLLASLFQIFGRWPFRCRSCRVRFFRYAPPPEDF